MADSPKVPLVDKPGVSNWVERYRALPKGSWIRRAAEHLRGRGMPTGRAIAVAVNAAERMCSTGDTNFPGVQQVNPKSRAEACAALAIWKAAAARAKSSPNLAAAEAFRRIDLAARYVGAEQGWKPHVPKGAVRAYLDLAYTEKLHPRGEHGKWVRKIVGLLGNIDGKPKVGENAADALRSSHRRRIKDRMRALPKGPEGQQLVEFSHDVHVERKSNGNYLVHHGKQSHNVGPNLDRAADVAASAERVRAARELRQETMGGDKAFAARAAVAERERIKREQREGAGQERAYIVTGRGTGNLYVRGASPEAAKANAGKLLGEVGRHRAGSLSAREIPDPKRGGGAQPERKGDDGGLLRGDTPPGYTAPLGSKGARLQLQGALMSIGDGAVNAPGRHFNKPEIMGRVKAVHDGLVPGSAAHKQLGYARSLLEARHVNWVDVRAAIQAALREIEGAKPNAPSLPKRIGRRGVTSDFTAS